MGLAVAHGLVSEMHGMISASNVQTGGARFEIVLPLNPVA
jgi:K+-sensing histidine kinase KdpD